MYSREYLFVRKIIVDTENQQLVLMSRGIEHPKCPESKKYVRVRSYKSNLVLKPHTTLDEVGRIAGEACETGALTLFSGQRITPGQILGDLIFFRVCCFERQFPFIDKFSIKL